MILREIHANHEIFETDEYAAILDGFEDDFHDDGAWVTYTRVGNAVFIEHADGFRWLQYFADEAAAAATFSEYAGREDD